MIHSSGFDLVSSSALSIKHFEGFSDFYSELVMMKLNKSEIPEFSSLLICSKR